MIKQIAKVGGVSLLVLFLGAFSMCFGQGSSGNIGGTVSDAKGGVVAGATVEATNQNTGEKRSAVTGDNGAYTITNLGVGLYTVSATATGFAASTVKDVKVSVAFTVPVDVTLN